MRQPRLMWGVERLLTRYVRDEESVQRALSILSSPSYAATAPPSSSSSSSSSSPFAAGEGADASRGFLYFYRLCDDAGADAAGNRGGVARPAVFAICTQTVLALCVSSAGAPQDAVGGGIQIVWTVAFEGMLHGERWLEMLARQIPHL